MAKQNTPDDKSDVQETFADKVNNYVETIERNDEGKLVFPEEMDEATRYAVTAEVRRRDTQATYSRTQAELARIKAENEALAKSWEEDAVKNLSSAEQAELEELKHTDPDKWREEMDKLETSARSKFAERRQEVSTRAQQETEKERRVRELKEFQDANPDITINDEVIDNEIPPKYSKQLEKGEITFTEFLNNVKDYLTAGKVIKKDDDPAEDVNLSKVGGKSTPSEQAIDADIKDTYKDVIF